MKNTDFMNLSLPEGSDKIDVEILNNDFTAIENLLKQHAITETMTLNGEGVIIGAIGPYIRLQNIDASQVSIDIGKETYTLASGENIVIRETAENIGIITSGNVNITYFVNSKTYADKEFYTKEKVDELLSNVEATVEVDAELSETSENPVQNKVITAELASYATTAEVENKVTEKVAELVAGAPEDFDTLKELSDWLKQHENSAATMNSAIQKNAEDIAIANTNITKNTEDIVTANENIQAIKNDVLINQSAIGFKKKNLLNNTAKSTITNGITFTVNDDKTITVNGTATATTAFEIGSIANITGNCILSGCPSGGTFETYALAVYSPGGTLTNIVDYGNKKTGDFTNQYGTVKIRIAIGTTVDNLLFAPMLRYADITNSTYEPYTPSLQEQINALLARIETLEGATATTEGGE